MGAARYKRGGLYAADMKVYADMISEENTNHETMTTLKRNLLIAIRQELSSKQREYIQLYYAQGLNMSEIADQAGVSPSTVSRTIKRGEAHLRRCLRFGAANLLDAAGVNTPYRAVRNLAKREGYENC